MALRFFLSVIISLSLFSSQAQKALSPLTVEEIMKDPKWMGSSPSSPQWSIGSDTLFFRWNPDVVDADSLYFITIKNRMPQKASPSVKRNLVLADDVQYNKKYSAYIFENDGDIFYKGSSNGIQQLTQTTDREGVVQFGFRDSKILYMLNKNLFARDIETGMVQQLTDVSNGAEPVTDKKNKQSAQQEWLSKEQLELMQVLKERKENNDKADAYRKAHKQVKMRTLYTNGQSLYGYAASFSSDYISYKLYESSAGKNTIIPNFITESGFTEDIRGRSKVGESYPGNSLWVYDRIKDTAIKVDAGVLTGIKDMPLYQKDYPVTYSKDSAKASVRAIQFGSTDWSPTSERLLVEITSADNKDRWLALWDAKISKFSLLDRQHDDAWIQGPGIDGGSLGWIDDETIWYQSEKSGFAQLYSMNVVSKKVTELTSGAYEVQEASINRDHSGFYITTNEVHPGEQQLYFLNLKTGKKEQLTSTTGAHKSVISPDESFVADLYSYSTKPWELFLLKNKKNADAEQITFKAQSERFKSYPWRDPEVVSFKARDGVDVYARVYKPKEARAGMPAVLFVHGAGYLQNAHKWWSNYFREFMFNNLLADNGYYVIDVDYRASAGYGRNFRTGIYRHMGGQDLEDNIDAVKYLSGKYKIDTGSVGLYGGSYGGFITLMGLFTTPDVFKAGAALRPVTDWSNYNHGYTSNILNVPFKDSIAYRKSSPIYFAEGLKGHLLICHGMVDVNVHYQDVVKLTQRLIELHKENWELASYPMEDHGFKEPSSWTDEYKRIFKLFENVLKK